jgi:hypothetical protein
MKTYYVGLDVHSKKSAFVIEDNGGKVIAQGEVATTPEGFSQLQATYQLAGGTRVALETGTVAFFVARQLGRLGARSDRGRCSRGAAQGTPTQPEERWA